MIPVIALVVHVELTARRAPVARKRGLRFFVRLPVAERRRVAFDPERAHLARGHCLARGIHDLSFITCDDAPKTAGLNIAEPVRDVDVEHFGRADAVQNLDAERLQPTFRQLDRQSLARRQAHAKRRQVSARSAGDCEHPIYHRRHARQNRRAVRFDDLEHFFGRRAFGEECGRAARGEREEEVRARRVAEEELRDGDGKVVFVDAQNALRVALRVERQVVLQVDSALRASGRTGSEEPDGRVVAVRVSGR